MFLYKRSISPHYGMFVLNRNGVDNFAVPLTADDELDLSEQFVILRTQEETILEEDEEDEETIVGVWVFEKEQRQLVGEAMLNIQSMAREEDIRDDEDDEENDEKEQSGSSSLTSGANVSQPHSGSISLDALFASGKSTPSQSSTNNNGTTSSGGGPALLDAIFQSASTPKSTPKPANQQVAPAPHADSTPTPSSASASVDAANDLMAMLGLKAPPNTTTTTNGHDPSNPPPIAKDTHAEPPQNLRDTSVNLIDDAMASKHDPTTAPPLSKGEFVREVLSLIHVSVHQATLCICS